MRWPKPRIRGKWSGQRRACVHRVQNGRPSTHFPRCVCSLRQRVVLCVEPAKKRTCGLSHNSAWPGCCLAMFRTKGNREASRVEEGRRSASLRHFQPPATKISEFVAKNKSRDDGSSRANRPRSWRKKKRTSCRAASRSTAGTMHAQLQVTSWACHARRLLPCRLGAEKASRSPADPHLPEVLCAVCSLQVCCRTRSIRA